ncbi:MAG: heme-binding protein, partial [Proteobacteria bacterium]
PMVGERVGGIVIFGGGLALYDNNEKIVGALGVSGDTSCADHNIAWRTRNALKLDHVPNGVAPTKPRKSDQIIYDIGFTGKSKSGFGHPVCLGKEKDIAAKLSATSAK